MERAMSEQERRPPFSLAAIRAIAARGDPVTVEQIAWLCARVEELEDRDRKSVIVIEDFLQLRSDAKEEAGRWKAQASLLAENIEALTKERDALRVDVNALRRCYFWLADDQGIEPVCDEYDPAGPGAGVEEDGLPQCANCEHPKVTHEQPVGAELMVLIAAARAWAGAIERADGIAAAEQELLKAVKGLG